MLRLDLKTFFELFRYVQQEWLQVFTGVVLLVI